MTHPEELLAGYVDGTLTQPERAVVDAHLDSCETCRDELHLARAAVVALGSLEEVPVPFGVTGPVLAEAGKRFERRRDVVWQRVQWVAGAGVAAALVLVVALNMGGERASDLGAAAPDAASTGATGTTSTLEAADDFGGLEDQAGVDYDEGGIQSLAGDEAARAQSLSAGSAVTEDGGRGEDTLQFAASDQAAVRCVRRSGGPVGDPRDELVRLIRAEFNGTPAYLAVFLEGPGAGQAPDTVVVWVASVEGCTPLSFASQRI